jgi:molybdopterin-guanine dinucleotide biosynthesis protein A
MPMEHGPTSRREYPISESVTGIILSGGRSTRMGSDKALVTIAGKPAIQRIAELMAGLFPSLILSTNTPEAHGFLGLEMVADLHHGAGPLAGIHAGLRASTTERSFVMPCDAQLMTEQVIRSLVETPTERAITVARAEGRIQRLPGVFHRSCLPVIEALFQGRAADSEIKPGGKRSGCSLGALFDRVGVEVVHAETDLPGYVSGSFTNMNNEADLAWINTILQ